VLTHTHSLASLKNAFVGKPEAFGKVGGKAANDPFINDAGKPSESLETLKDMQELANHGH
ncbi:MAG: hypothetical protein ACRD6N_03710, partial [Pyrinomonadaceae bacterium]